MTIAFIALVIFNLCYFTMSLYTLIYAKDLEMNIIKLRASLDELIGKKIDERIKLLLNAEELEPGVYMPRKDMVTGETGYQKMDIDNVLSRPNGKNDDDLIQSLLDVTGETHGR